MERDFDLIVVGSGAGGGTLASQLAAAGVRVLVLERGSQQLADTRSEWNTLIKKQPYDDRTVDVNGTPRQLYMGSGPGGSTSLYGAALLRPAPDDFHPGRFYGSRIDRAVWDWPVNYEQLEPYYAEAERLYRVASDEQDCSAPVPSPCRVPANPPLPLTRANRQIVTRCRRAQLRPFQLPLAIETAHCLRCSHCAGFPCPTGARRDAAQLLNAAADSRSITVLRDREVVQLVRRGQQIDCVEVLHRTTGQIERYRGHRYVIAAGAIGTARILQCSGYTHPALGRHYMMHYSPIVAGIFPRSTEAERTFVKQIGFADFYFGTAELPEKMGLVQSLPAPGPLMLKKTGLRHVPTFLLNRLRRHLLPFVGIVEDLPDPRNCVLAGENGTIRLRHRYSDYDRARGAALARAMKSMLRIAGAIHCVAREIPSTEHVAHQCGTVRFGIDPEHAVVDADCRMFQQPDVFVVDGSILPTSLGVGPSLTIIANALRVADVLQSELTCATTAACLEGASPHL